MYKRLLNVHSVSARIERTLKAVIGHRITYMHILITKLYVCIIFFFNYYK